MNTMKSAIWIAWTMRHSSRNAATWRSQGRQAIVERLRWPRPRRLPTKRTVKFWIAVDNAAYRSLRFTLETEHSPAQLKCPLRAKSGHLQLFDHLVGSSNQRRRHRQAARHHFDARHPSRLSEGGAGAFGGSGPTAELS